MVRWVGGRTANGWTGNKVAGGQQVPELIADRGLVDPTSFDGLPQDVLDQGLAPVDELVVASRR